MVVSLKVLNILQKIPETSVHDFKDIAFSFGFEGEEEAVMLFSFILFTLTASIA